DQAGLQDRQAHRRQQRRTDALQQARHDQHFDRQRQRAQQRRRGEPDRTDDEDPAAPEPVSERTTQQDQRRQRQQIAVEGPLQPGAFSVQHFGYRGRRGVADGGAEERHRGPEHRRRDRPRARGGAQPYL